MLFLYGGLGKYEKNNSYIKFIDIDGNVLTMELAEWYTNCRRFLNLISFRETTWKGGFFVV